MYSKRTIVKSSLWRVVSAYLTVETAAEGMIMANVADVVTQETLTQIERRILELERVRAVKTVGSWLYELDTGQIERLRALRNQMVSALAVCGQCA